jgi:uncharacterized damage-inducible protein DinB
VGPNPTNIGDNRILSQVKHLSELESIRNWFAYNARARQGYIEAFGNLPKDELSRDRGASYPTMLGILEHTMGAYYFWINKAVTSDASLPRVGQVTDTGENPSLDEIKLLERQVQAMIKQFLDGLTERDLGKTFVGTRERVVSIRDMLWHLVEEELQHRGELNALLWQIDVDAPIFSWIDWIELPKPSNE